MNTYGYVRVSSTNQNEHRQLDAMASVGVPGKHIYMDKQSGRDFDRPAYRRLLKKLKPGDLLYISSLDRLGRSLAENQEQWRILTKEKKIDIVVLDMMPLLDTRQYKDLIGTFISDLVMQILSFVAESECENTKIRQAQGIAAARARGIHLGRPPKPIPEHFPATVTKWRLGEISLQQALSVCNMERSMFYRKVQEV